jgi:hypothetical protein
MDSVDVIRGFGATATGSYYLTGYGSITSRRIFDKTTIGNLKDFGTRLSIKSSYEPQAKKYAELYEQQFGKEVTINLE